MPDNILQIAKDQLDKELDEWETSAMSQWEKLAPKDDRNQSEGNSTGQGEELGISPADIIILSRNKQKLTVKIEKGGKGSGNFGHSGRSGLVGGSGKASKLKPAPNGYIEDKEILTITGKDTQEHRDRGNLLIEQATRGKVNDLESFIYSAYEFKDEKSGISTKVTSIGIDVYREGTKVKPFEDTIQVAGNIFNKDGEYIGEFKRTIASDGKINNDYMSIVTNDKASGFGSAFYKNTEEVYKEAGIDKVEIYANIDVGGYAWARMGYDFDSDYQRQNIFEKLVEKVISHKTYEDDDYNKVFEDTLSELKDNYNITQNSKAWEFAAFTYNGMRLGKEAMLGSHWDAYKPMDIDSEGWQVGQDYYGAKGL